MLSRGNLFIATTILSGIMTAPLLGGEMALVPVDATGPHTINGNEITVQAGRRVFLEIKLSNWDPDGDGSPLLRAWLAKIDSTGYSSGLQGVLTPFAPACSTDDECQRAVHPAATCGIEYGSSVRCTPGFFDKERPDYVYAGLNSLSSTDFSTLDFRFGDVALTGGALDSGSVAYGATLVLAVPTDASGTFTVGLHPVSNMVDESGMLIEPLTLHPARITIGPAPDRFAPTNRYLAIAAGESGQARSIRVTFADLPAPFDMHNGLSMWVGEPRNISTNGHNLGPGIPGFADFPVAPLQCEKHTADFGALGVVEVYGRNVVPDGVYDVDVFDDAVPPNLISSSTMFTSRWGDAAGSFNGMWQFWESPDDRVDIVTDAIAMLDAFRSLSVAPFKTFVDIQPAIPDHRVTIVDVTYVISAFSGMPYPFEPVAFPCAP